LPDIVENWKQQANVTTNNNGPVSGKNNEKSTDSDRDQSKANQDEKK
jgi:hypothetical protein